MSAALGSCALLPCLPPCCYFPALLCLWKISSMAKEVVPGINYVSGQGISWSGDTRALCALSVVQLCLGSHQLQLTANLPDCGKLLDFVSWLLQALLRVFMKMSHLGGPPGLFSQRFPQLHSKRNVWGGRKHACSEAASRSTGAMRNGGAVNK